MAEKNKVMFVVNPVSGSGRTKKKWQAVEKKLRREGYHFEVRFTEKPWHAIRITSEALQAGYNHIIAVGGDGTINEVLNGFYQPPVNGKTAAAFSVLPMGTASDLSRALHLSNKIDYIEKLLKDGQELACDVAYASYIDWEGKPAARYFINVADVGIGSDTVARVNRNSKSLGGFLSFLIAFLTSIFCFKNPVLTVEVDGKIIYSGKSSMVAVNNGQYFGGGMMVAPDAVITDGLLDITILEDCSKSEFLITLPRVYKGKHVNHPKVRQTKGRQVKISAQEKVYLEVDGESPGIGDVEIQILPGDLKLLI